MTRMNDDGFRFKRRKAFAWRKRTRHNGYGNVTEYVIERVVNGKLCAIARSFSEHDPRIGIAAGLRYARWQIRQAIAGLS